MLSRILLSAVLLVASLDPASYAVAAIPPSSHLESIKETFIPSGEAKLFCRVTGQGKPLIVIHGGPGLTQDYLLPQMYELAKNNLVIFYDQRGCGKSTVDINVNTINLESFVDDIEAIRQAFNLDKISILGHSWGGFLAMQYTIAHPERVDKLILSNSAPASSEGYALFGQEYMRRMAPYQEELEKIRSTPGFRDGDTCVMEQFYRLIFRQYCYIPEKADLLNLRMTSIASLNGAKVSEIIRENVLDKPFNLNKSLKALKVSTLILHGDADPIPPNTAQDIHEHIFGSKYVLMKNCGHFPYVEDPATYFEHINEFLNTSNNKKIFDNKEFEWRIGGKIHFEEESGPNYIGINEINQLVKESLKKLINFKTGISSPNAKIMLKRDTDQIIMTHYEEKNRPGIGEELHATLLYTQPRGFCNSETLKQVCENLFKTCDFPPSIESVSKTYSSIIKPEWKFKISEVVLTKSGTGSSFIIAKLLFDGHENIYKDNKPISAGLHMTLVNLDDSILDNEIGDLLISEINKYLKGKFVKIAERNGIADLEFGISGSSWRIRAEERIR